nr:cysteine-rich KTR domain-containing protein [Parablautia sp. Marseille-Q6255]
MENFIIETVRQERKNYPLYCPKCKQETLIEVINLQVTVIKKPDAQTQSR